MTRLTPQDAGELLRARGLRSTPQRRAILSVFSGGRSEHLSADEIHARASRSLPDLSRATVYATLAEFSELGLLSAFGSPEPVRYENNLESHAHFRCRLCSRIFDLVAGQQDPGDIRDPGFVAERVEVRAEGICGECTDYEDGLRQGAIAIMESGPATDTLSVPGTAVSEIDSPLGRLLLAATARGLTRVAFADHGDVSRLRDHAARRRGSQDARRHLMEAHAGLQRYFRGELARPACGIDWERIGPDGPALLTTESIPHAAHRSYSDLDHDVPALELGHAFGANPVPIFMPCHRVSRGIETPTTFVGGSARREWLETHEQTSQP